MWFLWSPVNGQAFYDFCGIFCLCSVSRGRISLPWQHSAFSRRCFAIFHQLSDACEHTILPVQSCMSQVVSDLLCGLALSTVLWQNRARVHSNTCLSTGFGVLGHSKQPCTAGHAPATLLVFTPTDQQWLWLAPQPEHCIVQQDTCPAWCDPTSTA